MEKKVLRVKDLIEAKVGSRSTIYGAINSGALRAKKRGRSTIFLPSWVDEYIASLPDFKATNEKAA